jgi:predicted site-specific integrase-resolvase
MKLSTWAKEQGIGYEVAWRMFRDGKLPVPAEQLPTGTIIVKPPKVAEPWSQEIPRLLCF